VSRFELSSTYQLLNWHHANKSLATHPSGGLLDDVCKLATSRSVRNKSSRSTAYAMLTHTQPLPILTESDLHQLPIDPPSRTVFHVVRFLLITLIVSILHHLLILSLYIEYLLNILPTALTMLTTTTTAAMMPATCRPVRYQRRNYHLACQSHAI
jgi:hypothetical protein